MPQRIALVPHLTTKQLAAAARKCDDADKRTRIEAIRLVSMDWDFVRVGEALDFQRGWVRTLVKRFNESGLAGLDDGRGSNAGREPLLDKDGMAALRDALAGPAPDGGLWSGPKVRAWISKRLGKPAGKRAGWRALQRAGCSLQRPQTRHASADVEAQDEFKKSRPAHRGHQSSGPRSDRRSLGPRRSADRAEADDAANMGAARPAPCRRAAPRLRVALSVRIRSPGHR